MRDCFRGSHKGANDSYVERRPSGVGRLAPLVRKN